MLGAIFTAESLLYTGDGLNLVSEEFLSHWRKEIVKLITLLSSREQNCEGFNFKSTGPLFVRICDLCVRTWLRVIKNMAVDVLLGKSFITSYKNRIFPLNRNSSDDGTNFRLVGNIARMHQSINDVPSSTSRARCLTQIAFFLYIVVLWVRGEV